MMYQGHILNTFGMTKKLAIQFLGQILKVNGYAILDTTSTDCFINSSYFDSYGLQFVKDPNVLQLATQEVFQVEGYVKLRIKVQLYYGHLFVWSLNLVTAQI